jgi:hypothetical protein
VQSVLVLLTNETGHLSAILRQSFCFLGVKSDMGKLRSFDRQCLALGFKEELWSLKQLYFSPEASTLRENAVSSTENMLAAVGVCFGTEI